MWVFIRILQKRKKVLILLKPFSLSVNVSWLILVLCMSDWPSGTEKFLGQIFPMHLCFTLSQIVPKLRQKWRNKWVRHRRRADWLCLPALLKQRIITGALHSNASSDHVTFDHALGMINNLKELSRWNEFWSKKGKYKKKKRNAWPSKETLSLKKKSTLRFFQLNSWVYLIVLQKKKSHQLHWTI